VSVIGADDLLAICRAPTRERSPGPGPDLDDADVDAEASPSADDPGPDRGAPMSAFTVLATEGDPECVVLAANEYILGRVIRDRRRSLPRRPAEIVRWPMTPLRDGDL